MTDKVTVEREVTLDGEVFFLIKSQSRSFTKYIYVGNVNNLNASVEDAKRGEAIEIAKSIKAQTGLEKKELILEL